jgi:hypothetical protein
MNITPPKELNIAKNDAMDEMTKHVIGVTVRSKNFCLDVKHADTSMIRVALHRRHCAQSCALSAAATIVRLGANPARTRGPRSANAWTHLQELFGICGAGFLFGLLGELTIVARDPEHYVFRYDINHVLCKRANFLGGSTFTRTRERGCSRCHSHDTRPAEPKGAGIVDLCDGVRSLKEAMSTAEVTMRESRALVARSRGKPYLVAAFGLGRSEARSPSSRLCNASANTE